VFGWQLGIDELLFRDTTHAYNQFRGRMSPYTSIAFTLIGLGLAALPRPALRPLVCLTAIFVMAIGAVAYVGNLWNVSELFIASWLPPVAMNTAFALLLLGAGTFLASRTPERQRAAEVSMARRSIESRILAGFIGALLLLFVASGYTYRMSAKFAESAHRVALAQQARAELNRLDGAISTAESVQRNYLLTGEPQSIETYARHAALVDRYEQNLSSPAWKWRAASTSKALPREWRRRQTGMCCRLWAVMWRKDISLPSRCRRVRFWRSALLKVRAEAKPGETT
jgi:hypothetical protein